jgi:two-component system, LytTR family, sensor kinase
MVAIPSAFRSNATPVVEDAEQFLSRRGMLALTSLFWAYVTVTDLVYMEGMRIEAYEVTNNVMFIVPWQQRVLQHALMLPVLLVCYSTAVRIGWQPRSRRVPQQLALALGFSLLMYWMMLVCGLLRHAVFGTYAERIGVFTKGDWAVWVSSTATTLLAYGFGLALITGVEAYRRYHQLHLRNSELRRDWAGARLAALRTQLSPHTLFNVLNTIQARISEPEVAQTLIASLGDLLRGLLQAGERDFAQLRDELQFVELYLGLQVGRFADRLTVHVQNGTDVPTVWVPSLILQPLVENAVVHGLFGHSGQVRIDVTWDLSPHRLQLRVVNSIGSGDAPSCGGLGLRNVRERLSVQFAGRAVLNSSPGANSTWVATIHLPVLREWRPGSTVANETRPT